MAHDIRRDFDEIALRLEAQGETTLASVIDLCSAEIHTRMARAQRRPKPRAAKVSAASVAGDALAQIRWARTELRDLARSYRKHGSVAEARDLLKLASDLADDEHALETGSDADLPPWEEPAVDTAPADDAGNADDVGDEGVADIAIDFDMPVIFPEGEGAPDDEAESTEESDETAVESGDVEDVSTEDEDQVVEPEEASLPPIETLEACLKEVRVLARMARRANNIKHAAKLTHWAMFVEASLTEAGDEAVVVPLPPTDGEDPIIDSTNFNHGDDDIVNFALEVEQEALGEPSEDIMDVIDTDPDADTDVDESDDGDTDGDVADEDLEIFDVVDDGEGEPPYEGGDDVADLDDSEDESTEEDETEDDGDEDLDDEQIEDEAQKYESAANTFEAASKLVAKSKNGYPTEVKSLLTKAAGYRKQAAALRSKKGKRKAKSKKRSKSSKR